MREAAFVRIALTTAGSLEEAQDLAHALVERRVAACVNLIPNLTSVYHWQGAVEETTEVLLLIKTNAEQLPALEVALQELHSYEVPELLAINVESAGQPYLDWLMGSVQHSAD